MLARTTALALAALLPVAGTAVAATPALAAATPSPAAVSAPATSDGSGAGALDATAPTAVRNLTGLKARSATRSTREAAKAFLRTHAGTTGVTRPDTTLRSTTASTTGTVTAERFDQVHNGVPVLGGQYVVRVQADATGTTVIGTTGSYYKDLTVATTPRVSAKGATKAGRLYVARVGADLQKATVRPRGLVVLPVGKGRLAHRVLVTGVKRLGNRPFATELLVDARNGALLAGWDRLAFADTPVTTTGKRLTTATVPLHLTKAPAIYEFRDTSRPLAKGAEIRTYDAKGADVFDYMGTMPAKATIATTPTIPAPASATKKGIVDAHWAAGETYDYYKRVHGRNGIDGKGGTMTSVVGVTFSGMPFPNAFWDGDKMVYGGGGQGWRPFSASLDVVAHEMTHGVIERSANLQYWGQSGAVNEALADYFGNAVQVDTEGIAMHLPEATLLGEDLCSTKSKQACAMRDLGDKRTTWQDFQGILDDNAGVHVNSTILSGALWDIRKRLGGDRTDKLVYLALTQYMTPTTNFADTRTAVLAAATQLGYSPAAKATIGSAFNAHGIVAGWEKKIGMDTTTLLPGIDYPGAFPDAGKGRWVVTDADTKLSGMVGIWGGSTTAKGGSTRLSPDDGWFHDIPATDGRTAIWAAGDMGTDSFRVWTRDLASGRTTKVWEGKQAVVAVDISGRNAVATTIDTETMAFHQWASVDGGPVREIPVGGELTGPPSLEGNVLAMSLVTAEEGEEMAFSTVLLDIRTGKKTVVPMPKPSDENAMPAILGLTLTPSSIVTMEIPNIFGAEAQVVRRPRTGLTLGAPKTLLDTTDEDAIQPVYLTATDTAVTAVAIPDADAGDDTGYTNETTSKLWQVPATGGAWKRVSCNRGEQGPVAADTGTRVVWIDGTNGDPSIVTKAAPVKSCD